MNNGFKKYAVIVYNGTYEEIDIDAFETDIEQGTKEFESLLEQYEDVNSTIIVVDFDKFHDAIKTTNFTELRRVTMANLFEEWLNVRNNTDWYQLPKNRNNEWL